MTYRKEEKDLTHTTAVIFTALQFMEIGFIIITKPISVVFIFYIAYKYGHIRFGGMDAKPEFTDFVYFVRAILSTCVFVSVVLFKAHMFNPILFIDHVVHLRGWRRNFLLRRE